jgi:hypothetical protein
MRLFLWNAIAVGQCDTNPKGGGKYGDSYRRDRPIMDDRNRKYNHPAKNAFRADFNRLRPESAGINSAA